MESKEKIVSHKYVQTPSGIACLCGKLNWCSEAELEIRKAERESPRVTQNEHGIQIVLKGKLTDDGEIRIVRRFGDRKIFIEAHQRVMGEKRSRFNSIEYDLTKEELETLEKGIRAILVSFEPGAYKGEPLVAKEENKLPGETKFEKGYNAGTVICDHCGRKTWAGRARNQAGFCYECYDLMGYVNLYSDEGNKVKEAEYQAKLDARMKKPELKT